MARVQTKRCMHCGKIGVVDVNHAEFEAFMTGVGHIQDVMPTTPAPIREQLITGTHPACWNKMMSQEEY